MIFHSLWLDDTYLSKEVEYVKSKFDEEYAKRFGRLQRKGLYRQDDWLRINYCYQLVNNIGKNVLDVGTGPGALLNTLHFDTNIQSAIGIDIRNYSKLVKLDDAIDIRIMDVGNMTFEDASFDTVICMEVLEHLNSDTFVSALSELRRVASERLIMTVPLCEPEPISQYHKKRFILDDIIKDFQGEKYTILQPKRGTPWVMIEENRKG